MSDVVIIGAGPAGLTAAIQLIRMGLDIVVLDPEGPGGSIRYAHCVENIPGFPFGATGEAVASAMAGTAVAAGVDVVRHKAERVEKRGEGFAVFTDAGEYRAAYVLLATGLADEPYDAPSTAQRFMRSLASKPPASSGETILIIGGGDVSFDQAMKWKDAGADVVLLHRASVPRALPRLVKAAIDAGAGIIHGEITGWSVEGDNLRAEIGGPDGVRNIHIKHVLPCIGRRPIPPPILIDGESVCLNIARADGETAVSGLYMAGDLKHPRARQVTLAMGDGMASALAIGVKCCL